MKNRFLVIIIFTSIILGSCNNGKFNYSAPKLDIEYVKGEETKKLAVPIDINIRDRAWIEAKYEKDYKKVLNAMSLNKNLNSHEQNKFTNWSISGEANKSYNLISGGYGYGWGYGYGSSYTYPSIELLFLKSEIPDIDKIYLGSSKDKIFLSFNYSDKRNVNIRTTDEYYIIWINLNNIPMKFIEDLAYIKIQDN
jgi:hypothetical protein